MKNWNKHQLNTNRKYSILLNKKRTTRMQLASNLLHRSFDFELAKLSLNFNCMVNDWLLLLKSIFKFVRITKQLSGWCKTSGAHFIDWNANVLSVGSSIYCCYYNIWIFQSGTRINWLQWFFLYQIFSFSKRWIIKTSNQKLIFLKTH